jgi:NADPH:quinone reductase-like Zn-dependent oxidoreductase
VCALLSGGGYAEFVRVPVAQTARVPDRMSWEDAAGLPEVAATVWSNLVVRGRLAAGERVLVHGGTSGVGSMAIQIAAALGATVTATVSAPEKVDFCRRLGATRVLVRDQDAFARTLSRSIDVVFDLVGAPYLATNLAVLRREGRLVQVGLLGGAVGSIDLSALLERNLTITGSGLRTRPVAEKGEIVAGLEQRLWPFLENGTVRSVIAAAFPLSEVREAHDLLESGRAAGKIVLQINPMPNSRNDEGGTR